MTPKKTQSPEPKNLMTVNRDAAVALDRDSPDHEGTGILMMRIRRRKPGEKPKHMGGKLYTREVVSGWIVDFDGDDKPIEIEVLSPSKHFPKEILDILPPEFVAKAPAKKRNRARRRK